MEAQRSQNIASQSNLLFRIEIDVLIVEITRGTQIMYV